MTQRALAWLDTETTSLRPDRRSWDIALIVRPPGGSRADDVEHQWLIEAGDLDLGNADLMSLNIGKFYDRHPQANPLAAFRVHRERPVLEQVERLTRGAVILGSNPSFDAGEGLATRLRAHGICPSWYYHPKDVPSIAEGWLIGSGRAKPPLISSRSEDVSRACGIEPLDYERHTAIGDCQWMRDLYDVVTAPVDVDPARRLLATELERRNSPLCDCNDADSQPISPRTGEPMAHHCDCGAVAAAATVLRRFSATAHAAECRDHTSLDCFYDGSEEPATVSAAS